MKDLIHELTYEEMIENEKSLSPKWLDYDPNWRTQYRFLVVDHYETGCGRTLFLKICFNQNLDEELERFKKFIANTSEYYVSGIEELSQKDYLDRYSSFTPSFVLDLIQNKILTPGFFGFQTEIYFNYS